MKLVPMVVYSGTPGVHSPVHMAVVNESQLVGAVLSSSRSRHSGPGAGGPANTTGTPSRLPRGDPGSNLVTILVYFVYVSFFSTVFVWLAWAMTMASLFLLCPTNILAPADFV